MFGPVFWWAVAGVGLMFCELVLPGLILFFFGLGALLVSVVAWLVPLSLTQQLVLFIVFSLATLFGLRRWLRHVFYGRQADRSEDAIAEGMVGQEGVVSEAIEPGKVGKIMLNGAPWRAESEEPLPKGRRVVVVGQKSLLLTVRGK